MRRLAPLLLAAVAFTSTGAPAAMPIAPPAKPAETSTRGPAVPLSDAQRAAIAAKHAQVQARTPRPAVAPGDLAPKPAPFETIPPAGVTRPDPERDAAAGVHPVGPGTPPAPAVAPESRLRDEAAAAAFRARFGIDVARRAGLAKRGDAPTSTAPPSGGPR